MMLTVIHGLFDVTKLTPQEFIDQFDQAWLKTLVRLHPEYNRVLKFDGYSASHLWADAFAKTETYAAAKQKGYLNPSGTSTRPPASSYGTGGADPFSLGTVKVPRRWKLSKTSFSIFRH